MGLLIAVTGLVLFGLVMVYSASFIFAQERVGDGFALIKKQILFAGLGFLALVGAAHVNYRHWARLALPILGLAVGMLVLVLIPGIGARAGGAQRWLHLGGLHFQPAEFAKFAVILFVARQLERKHERLHTLAAGVLGPFLLALPVFLLLMRQPDFGSTTLIAFVLFCMIFLAGVRMRYLAGALLLAGGAAAVLIGGSAYRRGRLLAFLDPWSDPAGKGFQVIQSMVGFFNGGLFGVGLGNGKEKLFFLPEAHNDFIFSVIAEELGFFGFAFVLLIFLYICYRGFRIAWTCYQTTQDRFGLYLASGITLALGLQGFVNAAVVLGFLPTKGLNLPFVSYGGSALLMDLMMVGVLLSISRRGPA